MAHPGKTFWPTFAISGNALYLSCCRSDTSVEAALSAALQNSSSKTHAGAKAAKQRTQASLGELLYASSDSFKQASKVQAEVSPEKAAKRMRRLKQTGPTRELEQLAWARGFKLVAGA